MNAVAFAVATLLAVANAGFLG
ncbi:unnamed protein product, partial [Allacma fusca]